MLLNVLFYRAVPDGFEIKLDRLCVLLLQWMSPQPLRNEPTTVIFDEGIIDKHNYEKGPENIC